MKPFGMLLLVACVIALTLQPQLVFAQNVLYSEDFESLELGPVVQEAEPDGAAGDFEPDEVWTNVPPTGWSSRVDPDMPGLDDDQKEAVARALGLDAPGDDNIAITYPGMVNQDMINVFYRAATQLNQNGWTWIERAQLAYMAATRMDRYEPYRGERVEQLPNLVTEEKDALQEELGAFQNF